MSVLSESAARSDNTFITGSDNQRWLPERLFRPHILLSVQHPRPRESRWHLVQTFNLVFTSAPTGHHAGTHPQPDERYPHDLQHLVLLQHVRAHDLPVCEGHQPDDLHL